MNSDQFVYWLQGFFEIAKPKKLTKEQTQEIENHLRLVFNKVTPVVDTQKFLEQTLGPNYGYSIGEREWYAVPLSPEEKNDYVFAKGLWNPPEDGIVINPNETGSSRCRFPPSGDSVILANDPLNRNFIGINSEDTYIITKAIDGAHLSRDIVFSQYDGYPINDNIFSNNGPHVSG